MAACYRNCVKSSQVVGLRDRVAIIRALLHATSSPQPYAGYGDLIGVGRMKNLSGWYHTIIQSYRRVNDKE